MGCSGYQEMPDQYMMNRNLPDGFKTKAALIPIVFLCLSHLANGFPVTDARGRTQEFESAPRRIVLAGRGLHMIADACYLFPEASSRIVAVERIIQGKGNFLTVVDPRFQEKTVLAVNSGPEQIAAVRPDAVLLKSYMEESLGRTLATLGLPVIYLDLETPEQFTRDLMTLGSLFGNEQRARDIVAFFRTRTMLIGRAVEKLGENAKPETLLLYYSERDGKIAFNVPPPSWMQTILCELAAGRPVWRGVGAGKGWIKVGLEQIAAWNPDQIFITAYFNDGEKIVSGLYADAGWRELEAVKTRKLHAFPGDYYTWDQPGPRWILGLMWLASKLHPDLFPEMDIYGEIRTFYRELYGLDERSYLELIQPFLSGDLP